MTELNEESEPEAAQPTPEWPEAAVDVGDPSVERIVAALDGLQALPVPEHEAVYNELHDALLGSLDELESLNEDAPGNGGA
jgi:hypothetical protein